MPTRTLNDLLLAQGNQGAILNQGQNQSQDVAQGITSFNAALLALLKRHQQLGTSPFLQQELNAKEAQAQRVMNTPSDLAGADPATQAAARNASASALNPTIQSAQNSQQTFGEQLNSFGNAIDSARQFMKEQQDAEERNRSKAAEIISLAVQQGSVGLESLLRESPDIFKKAGYNTKEFEAVLKGLKAKETEAKRQYDLEHASTPSTPIAQDYAAVRQQRIVDAVDNLLPRVNNTTVGFGSLTSKIPGTPAANFAADLETLKANISFSELQEMRNASKTGGALGQVAIRELELLESTLGALNTMQSPENFKKNLNKIKSSLITWEAAKAGSATSPLSAAANNLSSGVSGTTSTGLKYKVIQ